MTKIDKKIEAKSNYKIGLRPVRIKEFFMNKIDVLSIGPECVKFSKN